MIKTIPVEDREAQRKTPDEAGTAVSSYYNMMQIQRRFCKISDAAFSCPAAVIHRGTGLPSARVLLHGKPPHLSGVSCGWHGVSAFACGRGGS
ncbi:MAG: hypothetical protein K2H52_11395 [Lachnospiraceae bacterium]|nr:hypothetical protein [Lachnospiraceae bacterium]